MNGGVINTVNNTLVFNCIDNNAPVFRDYMIRVGTGEKLTVQLNCSKSIEGINSKLEIIDPSLDPLIIPTNQSLSSQEVPGNTDNNILSVSYTPDYTRNVIVRVSAQNSTGTVTVSNIKAWIGRGVLKRRVRL